MQFVDTPLVRGMQREAGEQRALEVMKDTGGKMLSTHQVRPGCYTLLPLRCMPPMRVGSLSPAAKALPHFLLHASWELHTASSCWAKGPPSQPLLAAPLAGD